MKQTLSRSHALRGNAYHWALCALHCLETSYSPGPFGITKFYDRKKELGIIKSWFKAAGKGALFTAIVGRRRTGKTRLWLEASKKMNNCLYLFCLPGPFKKTLDQVEPQLYALGFTSVPQDLTQFFKAVSLFYFVSHIPRHTPPTSNAMPFVICQE